MIKLRLTYMRVTFKVADGGWLRSDQGSTPESTAKMFLLKIISKDGWWDGFRTILATLQLNF